MTSVLEPAAAPLSPRAALRLPLIKRAIRACRPNSILEVGCGQGAMGSKLVGLARDYTAVEPDPESCRVARTRIGARGGEVIQASSGDLDGGRAYDMVCAFEVLEHIEDDAAALAEWRSLIRPYGHLLLSVPAWQHKFGPWDAAVGHYRRYSPDELRSVLEAAGFQVMECDLYGWPLAHALEAVRNRTAPPENRSMQEDTARSGRLLQPQSRAADLAITVGIVPFQLMQRMVRSKGNGIVALARRTD